MPNLTGCATASIVRYVSDTSLSKRLNHFKVHYSLRWTDAQTKSLCYKDCNLGYNRTSS